MVVALAEASLALPPGPQSSWAVIVSLGLLLAAAAFFLLLWPRLPAWMPVLVPLTCTASVLAPILAAGATSGVGIVLLIPLIWAALFHRRWESACVVLAIVAVEVIISLTPVAVADSVIARRILLWASLGTLISVATHGLGDRVRACASRPGPAPGSAQGANGDPRPGANRGYASREGDPADLRGRADPAKRRGPDRRTRGTAPRRCIRRGSRPAGADCIALGVDVSVAGDACLVTIDASSRDHQAEELGSGQDFSELLARARKIGVGIDAEIISGGIGLGWRLSLDQSARPAAQG